MCSSSTMYLLLLMILITVQQQTIDCKPNHLSKVFKRASKIIKADQIPTYQYTKEDTGHSNLGLYLRYHLGKLIAPSYHYYNYHGNNIPVYDHYSIHHYYHNRNVVPEEVNITTNSIVPCPGDSGSFCPPGTDSLCTANAAVFCKTDIKLTGRCLLKEMCVASNLNYKTDDGKEVWTKNEIPCLSTVNVIDPKPMFLSRVEDKTYCITVWLVPAKRSVQQRSLSTRYTFNVLLVFCIIVLLF